MAVAMVDASEYTEAQLGDKWVTWFFGFLFFFLRVSDSFSIGVKIE